MKAVIQRVTRASVRSGARVATIGRGLLVLVGLETGDTAETCAWAAAKITALRIFEDGDGKMNLGPSEVDGVHAPGRQPSGQVRPGEGGRRARRSGRGSWTAAWSWPSGSWRPPTSLSIGSPKKPASGPPSPSASGSARG
jgi:hypothetical protein